jgi:hypothetical protein
MRKSLTSEICNLIGIPLQTKMLADVYFEELYSGKEDKEEGTRVEITNIAELYQQFVETKIKIQFKEKWQIKIELNRKLYV